MTSSSFFQKLGLLIINRADIYFEGEPDMVEHVFHRIRELAKDYKFGVIVSLGRTPTVGVSNFGLFLKNNDVRLIIPNLAITENRARMVAESNESIKISSTFSPLLDNSGISSVLRNHANCYIQTP